mmetsp:Transcript_52882/g.105071  ORF Transcript_52882/g.105071 Transcript_52882/m.105071 type:complete len:238 (+) Transcript_52882:842-1555(+)
MLARPIATASSAWLSARAWLSLATSLSHAARSSSMSCVRVVRSVSNARANACAHASRSGCMAFMMVFSRCCLSTKAPSRCGSLSHPFNLVLSSVKLTFTEAKTSRLNSCTIEVSSDAPWILSCVSLSSCSTQTSFDVSRDPDGNLFAMASTAFQTSSYLLCKSKMLSVLLLALMVIIDTSLRTSSKPSEPMWFREGASLLRHGGLSCCICIRSSSCRASRRWCCSFCAWMALRAVRC